MTQNTTNPCQHVVNDRGTRPHHQLQRRCKLSATWAVTVALNEANHPLSMDKYNVSAIRQEYLLCGTHMRSELKRFKSEGDVWTATATRLR